MLCKGYDLLKEPWCSQSTPTKSSPEHPEGMMGFADACDRFQQLDTPVQIAAGQGYKNSAVHWQYQKQGQAKYQDR